MDIALYIFWFALPALFLTLAFLNKLQEMEGYAKKDGFKDLINQFLFVFACAVMTVFLDRQFIPWLAEDLLGNFFPLLLLRMLLFPTVLFLGAKLIGPTRRIMIGGKRKPPTRRSR